ncbi:hypothetical protein [Sulfuricurvum sp.]|nr:hypothetical protein [Sulfuricurvum sp.]MDD2368511.1 hypothetical protein [Sulfuricurvum sp.]MDD2949533.1 hypothetical protein [Sulfuricurvum sp.]MDD3596789.1 hypothetical protein [Sulfuricurvum sp.]MDD5118150.1 hypothetical protein [Sulfuricurvum sp.]
MAIVHNQLNIESLIKTARRWNIPFMLNAKGEQVRAWREDENRLC